MEPTERRPDVDIQEDISQLVRGFSPLKASQGYFAFHSTEGHIKVVGNVRSPQARRVLLDNIPYVKGVVDCDASELYDDETLRFAVGQLLPPGVYANVHYGAAALTGRMPDGASQDTIVAAIRAIPGVRRVGVDLDASISPSTPAPEKIDPVDFKPA